MVSIGIELNQQEYKKTSLGVRFLHNTRTLKTNNSIFSTEYCDSIVVAAFSRRRQLKSGAASCNVPTLPPRCNLPFR